MKLSCEKCRIRATLLCNRAGALATSSQLAARSIELARREALLDAPRAPGRAHRDQHSTDNHRLVVNESARLCPLRTGDGLSRRTPSDPPRACIEHPSASAIADDLEAGWRIGGGLCESVSRDAAE